MFVEARKIIAKIPTNIEDLTNALTCDIDSPVERITSYLRGRVFQFVMSYLSHMPPLFGLLLYHGDRHRKLPYISFRGIVVYCEP